MLIFQWNKQSLNHLTGLIIYTGYQRWGGGGGKVNLSLPMCTSERFHNPKVPVVISYKIILLNV